MLAALIAHCASNLRHARGADGSKSYAMLATALAAVADIGDFVALRSDYVLTIFSKRPN